MSSGQMNEVNRNGVQDLSTILTNSALDRLENDPDGSLNIAVNILARTLDDQPADGAIANHVQRRAIFKQVALRLGPARLANVLRQIVPSARCHPSKSLASILSDVGEYGTTDQNTVLAIFERFGISESNPPDEEKVSKLIAELLTIEVEQETTRSEGERSSESIINAHTIINLIARLTSQKISWYRVVRLIDVPEQLNFAFNADWKVLSSIFEFAPMEREQPTISALWGVWGHPVRQVQILDGLTSLSKPEKSGANQQSFTFATQPVHSILTQSDVNDASSDLLNSTWNARELIDTLIGLAELDNANVQASITALLEKGMTSNAVLVLIALYQKPQPWSQIHQELVKKLFAMFLVGHAHHQIAFKRLSEIDLGTLLDYLRASYNDSAMNISRILDVAQEVRIVDRLLESHPFFFAMDFAALASRRDLLDLDKWLQKEINRNGSDFIRSALEFIDVKVKDDLSKQEPQAEHTSVPLTVHTVATFLRVLRSNGDNMSPEEIDYFKAVRNLCLQLHPRLMNLAPGTEGQEPGLTVVTFTPDVHTEVDGYYRQMYAEQISIEDLISLLQRFKASENERERQVFACMVHTLFDEYRCFEMYYPPRELAMTAIVFGSLIQHQLIDFIPLGIAIRYVLDALRNPPESNMFKFGVQALLRFQDRLPEWPQLGQALLSLPNVQQSHPEIARIVRAAADGTAIPSGNNGVANGLTSKSPFSAINVEPPPKGVSSQEPDEQTSDKILFIVNNLSPSNLHDKLIEARRLIKPEIHQWLSSYLVLQRVSIEPNNHSLYTDFIDGLEAKTLLQYILHETLAKVKMLLNSDKTVQSTTERTILKNLGSWLGNLTLARNRPIRHRNIAFKELLIEGYDSNRLIVAIPFVCKVLEQCARSTIFKPPNPWLMAVLRLLVELYQFAELKLNLKFEIEVLCKSLNIDLKEVQCTSILRNRPQELAAQESAAAAAAAASQQAQEGVQQRQLQGIQPSPQQQQQQLLQQMRLGGGQTQGQSVSNLTQGLDRMSVNRYPDTLATMLQSLPAYVVFNPSVALFVNNGALKRMICIAIERAIREIIDPVVERSVTIAAISTRELITKDFAMESDENKMRKAAHQMAQNLAGSLALVTCKEPLRMSMVTHARTLLLQNGFNEQTLPEQAIIMIMQDNSELACSVVERAAMEKSLQDVDEQLANAYLARRDHQLRGRGYYWDANALNQSQYASTLPDLLKLQPDGLQMQQLRVYEEFGKLPRAIGDMGERGSTSPSMAHMPEAIVPYPSGMNAEAEQQRVQSQQQAQQQPEEAQLNPQQSIERFNQSITELERILHQSDSEQEAQNGQNIRLLTRQITVLSGQSIKRDETTLAFAQKVVQLLYKSETDFAREVYIHLLERLCEVSVKAAKEVTAWLIYAEDERKFNVAVTVGLIRAGLVNISELDVQLTKFLQTLDFKTNSVDFAANLAFTCLKEPACATRQQLGNLIEVLRQAQQQGKSTQSSEDFLAELQDGNLQVKTDVENSQPLREQLAFCFAEWIRLFQHSPNAEKSFIDFITQLQGQGILKGEEISSLFFRVCTEVSVDSYIKQKAVGGNLSTGIFQPIDAFSKLIVLMIKYHADPSGNNNESAKIHYLTKVLSIVVLVLAQSHEELGPHFQQKPFFRFFSSLLHDLHLVEQNLQGTYIQALLAISNTLNTLQPDFFPGLTFSWMSLISHRLFMPKLLSSRTEGWSAYYRLYSSLLRFLAPFLRSMQLQDTSRVLYRGTLRITLVLLHDYPEFLSANANSFSDLIPLPCVQLRNLILSSFNRQDFPDGLPDVFDAELSIGKIEQSTIKPIIAEDYLSSLSHVSNGAFKEQLDDFLSKPTSDNAAVLSILPEILVKENEGYSVSLLNSIVVHVGIVSLQKDENIITNPNTTSDVGLTVLQSLFGLEPEGRYLTTNAICNQLRYPNTHTTYFSAALLHLYRNQISSREAILRVLLERIIVNRPHPWGLLATMFELVKDRQTYPLPHDSPTEIVKLLEHISLGLGIRPTNQNVTVNGVVGPAIQNGSMDGNVYSGQLHSIPA